MKKKINSVEVDKRCSEHWAGGGKDEEKVQRRSYYIIKIIVAYKHRYTQVFSPYMYMYTQVEHHGW